ncbi:hypothetical protein D1BOALGB6SA_748 [Olavius sp. associated proteobacterium Delta 1]|nr:hypothetical protein D1BOALGB6SA_748 [Olavius sp. associated proteobacterium Delta 1]
MDSLFNIFFGQDQQDGQDIFTVSGRNRESCIRLTAEGLLPQFRIKVCLISTLIADKFSIMKWGGYFFRESGLSIFGFIRKPEIYLIQLIL